MGNPDQPRGPDGRWVARGKGWQVTAIGLAVILGAGGSVSATTGTASSASGSTLSATRSSGSSSSVRGKASDRTTARLAARLAREGLRVRVRDVRADSDCTENSYGQVRDYFCEHPCSALFRAQLEVRDKRGNAALVAVAWVDMPTVGQARQFQRLVDRGGTGNVIDLPRASGKGSFRGQYYRSIREGTTVINIQAKPVGRAKVASALALQAAEMLV